MFHLETARLSLGSYTDGKRSVRFILSPVVAVLRWAVASSNNLNLTCEPVTGPLIFIVRSIVNSEQKVYTYQEVLHEIYQRTKLQIKSS